MPINIHGKSYNTVAERIVSAGKDLLSVNTEVLYTDPVVIKATITTPKGTFTGISAANPSKSLEKESPYEVAETSAVGRALAFAGYETTNGIASAEEIKKTSYASPTAPQSMNDLSKESNAPDNEFNKSVCQKCGAPIAISKAGHPYCSAKCWLQDNTSSIKTVIQK
jgi:hypothetical protein